jgi:hypothetical protein|nr:MAG TPA: hypothetical protein [Caudoviricetes sp.]
MDTAMDVVSVVLFIVLIMYAAIKLDEAARKLRDEEERIYISKLPIRQITKRSRYQRGHEK